MFTYEDARLAPKTVLNHINDFEQFCLGEKIISPRKYRELNAEISVCAVLLIGSRRTYNNGNGENLIWWGPDNKEHDLGPMNQANIMRNYPGFHGARSMALGNHHVVESNIMEVSGRRGQVSMVKLRDGSVGIGPNYRIALRNAALKMHLNKYFNRVGLFSLIGRIFGYR